MGVRIGSGLSTHAEPRLGGVEAARAARDALDGAPADLAVVFASGLHLGAPEATLEGVHEALRPAELIGCAAGGVLGGGREIEGATGVAVWAAALGDGAASTFVADADEVDDAVVVSGLPDLADAAGVVLLADHRSFPTEAFLRELGELAPGVPVLGGLASAAAATEGALFEGERVLADGAVGVRLDGVELLPCVSQGAAPLGPEMTITAGEGQLISELAGQPALAKVREVVHDALSDRERRLLGGGLLIGIVVDPDQPEYEQGDFLVRGVIGADPEAGAIAVNAVVHPGQVVRLHARDAASADRDLRDALGLRLRALGGAAPAGALLFSCNGRGRGMFGVPDHDAEALVRELEGAPSAGFFAAGEIGPVGGENFVHGFTATVAIFP